MAGNRAQILITAVDETRRAFQSVQGNLARLRGEAAQVGQVLSRIGGGIGIGLGVRELVEVRATLEGLNAKLAAKRHDPAKVRELQDILSEGVRLAETADPLTLMRLNQRFHDALANIAANSVLRDIMRSLRDRTALLFSPMNSGRGKQNWEEHAAILRAVIDGDAELAALLATRHVYSAAHMQPA